MIASDQSFYRRSFLDRFKFTPPIINSSQVLRAFVPSDNMMRAFLMLIVVFPKFVASYWTTNMKPTTSGEYRSQYKVQLKPTGGSRSQGSISLLGPTIQDKHSPFMRRLLIRSSNNHNDDKDGSDISSSSSSSSIRSPAAIDSAIEELMAEYDPILLFVSRLLPSNAAKDAGALYAWCRRLDEICDEEGADPIETRQKLEDWERRFDELWEGRPVDELDAALTECLLRQRRNNNNIDEEDSSASRTIGLSEEPFRDMIAGMRADTVVGGQGRRIANLAELEEYAYQVAGTVGLMLLPLLEAPPEAKQPAISLGKAIQLINILRDASPDVALGRIYLPQDMLREQGVKDEDILSAPTKETTTNENGNANVSDGYRSVTRAVCERANELLEEAEVGKDTLPGFGPLLVQIIIELYRGYLVELEKRGYNNLTYNGERVKISKVQKVAASLTALQKIYFSPSF